MKKILGVLANVFGCLAAVFLVLAVLAVPTQPARADDPIPCSIDNPCPDGYACDHGYCTWLRATCSPPTFTCVTDGSGTACTTATDNVACYTPDTDCKCRVRNANGCTCGY